MVLRVGLLLAATFCGSMLHADDLVSIETATAVEIRSGDRLLLKYNTSVVEPPAGIDPALRRSGHIHPLNTPSGKTLTAEFPSDHAHQHGLFFAWVNTEFQGRKVDFWNQGGKTGTVEHVALNRVFAGTGQAGTGDAGFVATLHHVDLSDPHGPIPVLEEVLTVKAHALDETGYLVDVESRQTCIADAPLVLKEYHYGGFAFRGNSDWLGKEGAQFLTSEGRTRIEGNHSRPDWVGISGLLNGEPCGLTIFGHPGNFRAPQPVRLHPDKPYFVFSPEVLGEFKIFPGDTYVSRYRLHVHDGPANTESDAAQWKAYTP